MTRDRYVRLYLIERDSTIRELYRTKVERKEIARRLGISYFAVGRVIRKFHTETIRTIRTSNTDR